MNNQINQYQQRLFNKLFATLPSIKKSAEFSNEFDLDVKINHFYYFKNKDFWFTKTQKDDKYLFLFGIMDKPAKDICGKDVCLIVDFDTNIQFNDDCLGLFSIKNDELHILVNYKILKERYPYITTSDLKINNLQSFDNSLDLEIIDLGDLYNDNDDFIENLEKLINASYSIKSKKEISPKNTNKSSNICKICHNQKNKFKIDYRLENLKNIKPEFCGRCIEKIVACEFFTKISPLIEGNDVKELHNAKEKFGNDQLFDIGLDLLEKYEIITYIGVKKYFFIIHRDSYLVKKFREYSDKDNLLIDNITQINEQILKNKQKKDEILKETGDRLDSQISTTEKEMELVLEAISNGKSIEEAAKLLNITKYKILDWYSKGKQGDPIEYMFFFKRFWELENISIIQNKMDEILNEVKNGNDIPLLNFIYRNEANNWIKKGKQMIPPYDYFYDKYNIIIDNQIREYEDKEINRKVFLENFKSGKTKEESAKYGHIDLSLICDWYDKGRENIEPYVEFYNMCLDAKGDNKLNIPKVVKTDSLGNKLIMEQMNKILEYLSKGKSENEAIVYANVSKSTYEYWLNRGKQEFGELYIQFYHHVNQIKYESYDDDEVLEEVPEAKSIDPDIYAPLPKEYEEAFKSSPMNKTGIAWVNMPGTGKKFTYSKSINGNDVYYIEEDIYELHRKVKNDNHVWGIRDYERARKIIDIPNDFEVPSKPQIRRTAEDAPIEIDPDIYAPLPAKYDKRFNESQANKTGIAWVNYVGKKWIYQRNINKNKIYLTDENIYKLHQKVKKSNLTWGIKNYDKARKIIDIPKDYVAPKIKEEPIEFGRDILTPLPEKYLSSFNPNHKNKTGIAWVNRVGNKWAYQRKVNKESIKFTDSDIHKLHENVIKNNQIWGIIDFDKAIPIIESNQIKEEQNESKPKQKATKPINKSNVFVNYIEKSINEFDVIIKGVIRNKDLIEMFNGLKLFEKDIKRIITTSIGNDVDIFIELEINKYSKNSFEEKVNDLGWNINI